jgi:DNA-binding HxlR family transcriptional regulator
MRDYLQKLESSNEREDCRQYGARIEAVTKMLEGRWTIQVLCAMRHRPVRLSELKRTIPAASKKGITSSLRSLELMQVITRRDLSDSILHVEYEIAASWKIPMQILLDFLAGWESPSSRDPEYFKSAAPLIRQAHGTIK